MSPLIDDRGRVFGQVNLIDLLVVVALIALLIFAYVQFLAPTEGDDLIRTTFLVEQVREATFVQFEPGDEVRDEAGTLIGTVVEKTVEPSQEEVPTDDGDLVEATSKIYSDVFLTVEGSGQASGSTVAVGSVPLRVGKNFVIVGPTFEVRATIWDVEVLG